MLRTSLLPSLLLAATVCVADAHAARLGPPLLCHPIDIGGADSLPWGEAGGPFDRLPEYDAERVVADTVAILARSDDTLVHMETIRRALVYIAYDELHGRPRSWQLARRDELLGHLEAAATRLDSAGDAGGGETREMGFARRAGLAYFDLGYARAAFADTPLGAPLDDVPALLRKAAELRADDGALRVGIVLTSFTASPELQRMRWPHLDRALALAEDPESLLSRNLERIGARFLAAETRAELAAQVRAHRDEV